MDAEAQVQPVREQPPFPAAEVARSDVEVMAHCINLRILEGVTCAQHAGRVGEAKRGGFSLLGFLGQLCGALGILAGLNSGPVGAPKADTRADQAGEGQHGGRGRENHRPPVARGKFSQRVDRAGRPGGHGLVVEIPFEIGGQPVGRLVTAASVLLQTLHHDPVKVAFEQADQLRRLGGTARGSGGEFFDREGRQARARAHRFLLADRFAHGINALRQQLLRIKRRAARQQFIKQHAQAVNVAARINIKPAHLRLLGAHIRRCPDEMMQLRVNGRFGKTALRRLGDAEVNHLGHRHAVVQRDQDVGRLDVAMDNPLLVCVLNGLADLDEQVEPLLGGELVLVAVFGDLDAAHQFHHEEGASGLGGSGIEHLGDVRMVHHRQRLALRFEPGHHLLGARAQLDDLERDAPPHRFGLLSHVHHTTATLADSFQDFVASDFLADGFVGDVGYFELEVLDRFATQVSIFRFGYRQVGNKRLRFVGYGQHLLHACPQPVVAPAGLCEVGGPVLGREFPGRDVD